MQCSDLVVALKLSEEKLSEENLLLFRK